MARHHKQNEDPARLDRAGRKRENNMNLYEITEKYAALLDGLDIDEETGELLNADELEIAEAEFDEKAESYGIYIKNLLASSEAISAEQKQLQNRKKSIDRKIEALKSRLEQAMIIVGKEKYETAKVVMSFSKKGAVEILDKNIIPALYMREKTTFEPDKTAIKEAIKSGQAVDGAVIKYSLNIK